MGHGILEEDEIHARSSDCLIVLDHVPFQFLRQFFKRRDLKKEQASFEKQPAGLVQKRFDNENFTQNEYCPSR